MRNGQNSGPSLAEKKLRDKDIASVKALWRNNGKEEVPPLVLGKNKPMGTLNSLFDWIDYCMSGM